MKIKDELFLSDEFYKKMCKYEYGSPKYKKYFSLSFLHNKNAADLGDVVSQYVTGRVYFYGRDIPQNYDLAFKYFFMAYQDGYESVIPNLAYCYMRGLGTSVDYDKAIDLFSSIDDIYSVQICERLKSNCGIKEIKSMFDLYIDNIDSLSSDIGIISIVPEVNYDFEMHTYYRVEDYKNMIYKVDSIIKSIDPLLPDNSNIEDVFFQVYCALGLILNYDKSADIGGKNLLKSDFTSRNMYDALFYDKCTCGGISELFRNIMSIYGIDCINIFSNDHAFNQVKINDCWYYVDLSQDLRNIKNGFVDYCLKSDIIFEDSCHIPLKSSFYYECFRNRFDSNDLFKKNLISVINKGFVQNEIFSMYEFDRNLYEDNLEKYNLLISNFDLDNHSIHR